MNPEWRRPGGWSAKVTYGECLSVLGVTFKLVTENASSIKASLLREDPSTPVYDDGFEVSEDEDESDSDEDDEDEEEEVGNLNRVLRES